MKEEVLNLLNGYVPRKKGERYIGDVYFYVDECFDVIRTQYLNKEKDLIREEYGNYFTKESDAKTYATKLKLINEIIKRSAESENWALFEDGSIGKVKMNLFTGFSSKEDVEDFKNSRRWKVLF